MSSSDLTADTPILEGGRETQGAYQLAFLFFFMLANAFAPTWPPLVVSTSFANGGDLKIHHLIAFSMIGIAFSKGERRISNYILLFLGVAAATTVLGGIRFGFQLTYDVNIFYGLYLALLGTRLWENLGQDQFLDCLRVGSRLFLFAVFIEMVVNYQQYLDGFNGIVEHAEGYLAGGGPGSINSEVSYAAFATALEFNTVYFWPAAIFSAIFGIGAVSRSGELAVILVIGLRLWLSTPRQARLFILIALAVMILTAVSLLDASTIRVGIWERFLEIGSSDEKGSLGRLVLWYGAIQAFLAYPFGYGAGAGSILVGESMPNWLGELNLHNIYLQFAVDLGIQGVLAFVPIIYVCVRNFTVWGRWRHPLGMVIMLYFLLGFQGFRGYDPVIFLLYGAFLCATQSEIRQYVSDGTADETPSAGELEPT